MEKQLIKPKSQRRRTRLRHNPNVIADVESYLGNILDDAFEKLNPFYCRRDLLMDKATIKRRLTHEGLAFSTTTLPKLSKGLFDLLETGSASFPSFSIERGAKHPQFLRGLFDVALRLYKEPVVPLERYRVIAIDAIYMIGSAFKKLKGPYKKEVLAKQYREFVEVDGLLSNIDWFSEPIYPILERARLLMSEFIKDIDLSSRDFIPRPGPGATNTPREKHKRYEPFVFYSQIDRVLPIQEWFYPNPFDACIKARRFLDLYNNRESEPISRFKFVPKTAGKARGICIEENEMQWVQQAIRRGLTKAIYKRRFYAERTPINDQSINSQLATTASVHGHLATIDMSEASDRISRELVSWLFQDNESLHDALMAVSTRWIKPPEEAGKMNSALLKTQKFAPMGSAVCFPVMTLVHFNLIRAIILETSLADRKTLAQQVYVFGDDIIIPTDAVEAVYTYLPLFGMKLNTDKSFYRCKFRESCGTHAYEGVDITPVFVKTINFSQPAHILTGLACERDLTKKGYVRTARFLRTKIRKACRKMGLGTVLEYMHKFSPVVSFQRDTVSPLARIYSAIPEKRIRWNKDLQCREVRMPTIVNKVEQMTIDDGLSAYLRWLVLSTEESEKVGVASDEDSKIVWRWLPESALRG